jgi:hypothetical protein
MILAVLACGEPTAPKGDEGSLACPAPRVVTGSVSGTVTPSWRVAAIDASNFRFGDAQDVSDVATPDAATGAFSLCLDEAPASTGPFLKAFVAAWADLDGDDRYDARDELRCDDPAGSWTFEYLYHQADTDWPDWSYGTGHVAVDDPAAPFRPVLDATTCAP